MKQIKYKTINDFFCQTLCKTIKESWVGSCHCQGCKYFIKIDKEKRIVWCKAGEEDVKQHHVWVVEYKLHDSWFPFSTWLSRKTARLRKIKAKNYRVRKYIAADGNNLTP